MKKNKLFLLLGATLILTSCGGVKYTELTKGSAEYDEAVAMISEKVQTPTDYKSAGFTVSISGMTAAYGLSQKMDLDMAFEVAMNDDSIQGYISMENEGNYLYLFVIQNSEKTILAIDGAAEVITAVDSEGNYDTEMVRINKVKIETAADQVKYADNPTVEEDAYYNIIQAAGGFIDIEGLLNADTYTKLEVGEDGSYRITYNASLASPVTMEGETIVTVNPNGTLDSYRSSLTGDYTSDGVTSVKTEQKTQADFYYNQVRHNVNLLTYQQEDDYEKVLEDLLKIVVGISGSIIL